MKFFHTIPLDPQLWTAQISRKATAQIQNRTWNENISFYSTPPEPELWTAQISKNSTTQIINRIGNGNISLQYATGATAMDGTNKNKTI